MDYQSTVHNVQGCQYTEFRGAGHPSQETTLSPSAGDIYLDTQAPRGVWVYSGTVWIQWISMENARSVLHPNMPRILCPNAQRFAWVPEKGFAGYKRQVELLLDGQQDNAHVHVTNILTNEGTALDETEDKTSSKDADDSGSSDSEGSEAESSDMNHSSSKPCEAGGSSVDDPKDLSDVDAMMVDIPDHEDEDDGVKRFESACYNMRRANAAIYTAVKAEGPGVSRFVSSREGVEFPVGTETIKWPAHNVDTFMPFTGVPGSRDRDGEWVEYMAKAPSATTGTDPFAVVLDIPVEMRSDNRQLRWDVDITSIKNTFFQQIRYHLSNNQAVIVHPWYPDSNSGFSVDEIGLVRPTITNTVHWQDAKERAKNFDRTPDKVVEVVKHMRFADFILDAHNTDVCGNVLDLQNLKPEAPNWLNQLADDINAMYLTRSDHYGNTRSSRPTAKLDLAHLGPQTLLHDMWRSHGWDIATHGGFLTYIHHDVSGLATTVYPRSGAKIWGLLRLKSDVLPNTREKLFDLYEHMMDEQDWSYMQSITDMRTILLEEGDILIQPPGAWHTVYTPVCGMTSGSHLIMYEALHLMEQIRAFDASIDKNNVRRGVYATNETHSVDRQLIRMMLAMPDLVGTREFRRRPVLAHIIMVDNVKGAGSGEAMPKFSKSDYLVKETQNERMAAMEIAKEIMKNLKMDRAAILRELSNRNDIDWYSPGEVINLDFLRSMIRHAV